MGRTLGTLIILSQFGLGLSLCSCSVGIRSLLPHSQSSTHNNFDLAVFGQLDQQSSGCYGVPYGEATFCSPYDVKYIDGHWVVGEFDNERVIIYSGALGASSYVQIGGAYSPGSAFSSTSPERIMGIASNGTDLIVVEADANRVLIWNTLPTQNQQPADVVIGQPDFSSFYYNQGNPTPSANTLGIPNSATVANGKLFIADEGNNRVLGFNSIPTSNNASADFVLGQTDMVTGSGHVLSASTMSPISLTSDSSNLVVVDVAASRVLIFNPIPSSNNASAQIALGVTGITTNTQPASVGAQLGATVGAAFTNGGKLFVEDRAYNRVLFWNNINTLTSGQIADGVLGKPDLTTTAGHAAPFTSTDILWVTGGGLYYDPVSDSLTLPDRAGNRVTVYQSITTQNGSSAVATTIGQPNGSTTNPNQVSEYNIGIGAESVAVVAASSDSILLGNSSHVLVFNKSAPETAAINVIGAPDFYTLCGSNCPISATQIRNAAGIAVDSSGALYISDSTNNRVLVYNSIPTTPGATANYVLGQPSMTVGTANNSATGAQKLSNPTSLTVAGTTLFVTDAGNNRVLAFSLPITGNQPSASFAIGQPDTSTLTSGLTASKFHSPAGVASDGSNLYVGDAGNNRVLVFDPIPTASGATASYVLGQTLFTTSTTGHGANQFVGAPSQPTVLNGNVVVEDGASLRMLGFAINSLSDGMTPTWSISSGKIIGYGLITDPWTGWFWMINNYVAQGWNSSALSNYFDP